MASSDKKLDFPGLLFWIVVTFGIAAFASQFEPGDWYPTIAKPDWTPPGWVFGPVWGILYLLMSVSTWLVWRERREVRVVLPLVVYVCQLVVNGAWSFLFFGRQLIGVAFIDLVLLVALVIVTIVSFSRVNKWAGRLLVPYLLWIMFASVLNYEIWRLN